MGVNEGVVPADTGKGGILTEQEREILKRNDLELTPTAREEGFMQRFYLYLMMTKPSELLTLSYPGAFGLWEDPAAFQPHRPDEKTVSGGSRTGGLRA